MSIEVALTGPLILNLSFGYLLRIFMSLKLDIFPIVPMTGFIGDIEIISF